MSGAPLRLFVGSRDGARTLAIVEDRRLVEYRIDLAGASSRVGEIRLGRVQRVDKGIDAALVEIGLDRPGLLPLAEVDGRAEEGAAVLVQVVRDAREGKGVRLTGHVVLPGMYVVFDPHHPGVSISRRLADRDAGARLTALVRGIAAPGEGFVVRLAATAATPEVLAAEAERLRRLWRDIAGRRAGQKPPACLHRDDAVVALLRDVGAAIDEIVVDMRGGAEALRQRLDAAMPEIAPRVVFRPQRDWLPSPDEIEEQVEAALEPEVALPSGGSLLIEPGRTLTAIDVNSGAAGGDGGGRRAGERRLLAANLEAAVEVARQLRLRNLGGIVVVDFIDLRDASARGRVVEALRTAMAGDPAATWVGEMSRLGLVEMTRRRRGASLDEMLTAVCPTCGGSGRVPAGDRGASGGEE